ncbi:hypothetical protein ACFWR9_16130 [Streptomyces sp. NPDC058534]
MEDAGVHSASISPASMVFAVAAVQASHEEGGPPTAMAGPRECDSKSSV